MFEMVLEPTLKISTNLIEEAKKIINEKKPDEFTEEDIFIIELAFSLLQFGKENKK